MKNAMVSILKSFYPNVGFFDFIHGQRGMVSNVSEIHPVFKWK